MSSISKELEELLKLAAKDTGVELKRDLKELALYADEQATRLIAIVGQPGYEDALIAARDNVLLRAGITSVNAADRMQSRFIGILEGALAMASRLLTKGALPMVTGTTGHGGSSTTPGTTFKQT